MPDLSKAVQYMIDTANDDTHGYDQEYRNGPDYDCSSLVSTALYNAGFPISPYSWTGNMEAQLRDCGFVDCSPPWRPGDIHLNTMDHVCMSIDGDRIVQATHNENGGVAGGVTGDQTGTEIGIFPYYDYPWDMHLRYSGSTTGVYVLDLDQVTFGSEGLSTLVCQKMLACCGLYNDMFDGIAGTKTILAIIDFQTILRNEGKDILIDGICGPATWTELIERHS